MDPFTATDALRLVRSNPSVVAALERLPALDLPQCHVTAGCLFQTVWNLRSGRPADENIRDLDVFTYDIDLSWEAEDDAIRRVAALLADLPIRVELRNQARVHLWTEARFGTPCAPLGSARDGIDRFLVACTSVSIAVATGAFYAPDGLGDLAAGLLRVNPRHPRPAQFRAKAADYRSRWPWLRVAD